MPSTVRWVVALGALALAACSGGSGTTAGAVRVKAAGCTASDETRATVSVTCASGWRSGELKLAPSSEERQVLEGALEGIPAGVDCAFEARATEHRASADFDVHYAASLTRRFERGERDPLVVLVLQQQDGETTFGNSAPRIVGLTASSASVDMFGPAAFDDLRRTIQFNADSIVILNAELYDADGDRLAYRWDDGGLAGTFLDLDPKGMQWSLWSNYSEELWRNWDGHVPTTLWLPPLGVSGKARLTLTVKDTHAGTGPDAVSTHSASSLGVDVTFDPANAQAPVNLADGDHAPEVLDLEVAFDPNGTGKSVRPGQGAQLTAVVSDADGDVLEYTFLSSCPGAFFDATGNRIDNPLSLPVPGPALGADHRGTLSAFFVPAAAPDSGACSVTLYVDDGARGGRTRSSIQVPVVEGGPVPYGPEVKRADSSDTVIGRGAQVRFQVDAVSKSGAAGGLTYAVRLLSFLPIPAEFWPEPGYWGAFVGETTNATGAFAWRSASDVEACAQANALNGGETYDFLVTITDDAALDRGEPAINYAVLRVKVNCSDP